MNTEVKTTGKIKQILWNIFSSGRVEDDIEILRKIFLLNLISILGMIFLVVLGTIAYIQRYYLLCALDFAILLFLLGLLIALRKSKKHTVIGLIGTIVIGIFYTYLIITGGVNNTAYVWAFTYPLIALFLLGVKLGTLLTLSLLAIACIVFALGSRVVFFTSYSINLTIRFIPAYTTVFLFALVMERLREIVQSRLKSLNTELSKAVGGLEEVNKELQKKINEIKILQGIVPICSSCKKVRTDKGYWERVEKYVQDRSDARFSHGICPECAKKLYPKLRKKIEEREKQAKH